MQVGLNRERLESHGLKGSPLDNAEFSVDTHIFFFPSPDARLTWTTVCVEGWGGTRVRRSEGRKDEHIHRFVPRAADLTVVMEACTGEERKGNGLGKGWRSRRTQKGKGRAT